MASNNVWAKVRLGDIGRIITGKTPPSSVAGCFDGATLFITPSDMDGRKTISSTQRCLSHAGVSTVGKVLIPKNSVMVSCIGSDLGKVALAGDECVTNQQINSIVTNNDVDPEFVYYSLLPRKKEFRDFASGSAQPIINKSHFSEIKINLPPLKEQRRIARILGSLDEKIDLNRRTNETLEATACAIFQSWFVDFDPVRAKAEGRQPFGMDSDTAALFPSSFEESEKGQIPKGWGITKIGDLDLIVTDYVANGSFAALKENVSGIYESENYALFVRNTDLKCNFESKRFVDEAAYKFLHKSKLQGGEIIISNVGDVGSVYLCPNFKRPMTLGNNVIMLNSKDLNFYLYCFFKSYLGQSLIASITSGSVQMKFNKTDFRNLNILLPPENVLKEFNKLFGSFFQLSEHLQEQNQTFIKTRDLLLPKLMSGEVQLANTVST